MPEEKIYTIDGNNFSNFNEFIKEFNIKVFGDDKTWEGGLDQLDDLLLGGYGTPDRNEKFTIIWKNAYRSRTVLGHEATLKRLEPFFNRLKNFYQLKNERPPNFEGWCEDWECKISLAKKNQGETLFQVLVDLIVDHPNIELRLQ